jgi:hypothetical protein
MTPYEILLDILDKLCSEAPDTYKSYHPAHDDMDAVNAARSKAFIHLYLKVTFGLLDFRERDGFVTDGTGDGGIDAFFIDSEQRVIYFIQSKFRTSEKNFESKHIDAEELLMMDINKILNGDRISESGVSYSPKILRMATLISQIEYIGRYKYRVVILANAKGVTKQKIS